MKIINLGKQPSSRWTSTQLFGWNTISDVEVIDQTETDREHDILLKAKQLVDECDIRLTIPTYDWKVLLDREIGFELAYTFCELWQKKHPEVDIILPVWYNPDTLIYRML